MLIQLQNTCHLYNYMAYDYTAFNLYINNL